MTLPNFLIIGAQKAGTTWATQVLRTHPDVFMPREEVRYCNDHCDKGIGWYEERSCAWSGQKAVGKKRQGICGFPAPSRRNCRQARFSM